MTQFLGLDRSSTSNILTYFYIYKSQIPLRSNQYKNARNLQLPLNRVIAILLQLLLELIGLRNIRSVVPAHVSQGYSYPKILQVDKLSQLHQHPIQNIENQQRQPNPVFQNKNYLA
jgi:hypothetical protein